MPDLPTSTTTPLDYAAPDPPKRRRRLILWLALLTAAAHLLLTLLLLWRDLDESTRFIYHRFLDLLNMPVNFAADAGWLDPIPRAVLLFLLLPLNSLLYGCILTALAILIARSTRLLNITATASLLYPLLFAACLYGQWLTSWWVLGHRPQSSIDDPKGIPMANQLMIATYFAMLAIPFAACFAISLNLALILFSRPTPPRILTRLALFLTLWSALAAIFTLDPGHVLYWWFE